MATRTGRPKYEPTAKDRRQVATMSGLGLRHWEIAQVVGISLPTLRKHFAAELETGRIKATLKVAASLYRMATNRDKPSASAAIFWLRARADWSVPQHAPADPPPAPARREPPVGKKAQAEQAALSAADGTEWASLLRH